MFSNFLTQGWINGCAEHASSLILRRTGVEGSRAHYQVRIEPGASASYDCAIRCELESGDRSAGNAILSYDKVVAEISSELRSVKATEPYLFTRNEQFNDWLSRSIADLHTMRTQTTHGVYPYAGVPWFCTAFGRDGIITAFECLWFNPEIARGVLSFLAATQAEQENAQQDSQPGKILHEMRRGEMAALGEVPFGCYYGSIDATPLFVMLAGAFYELYRRCRSSAPSGRTSRARFIGSTTSAMRTATVSRTRVVPGAD